MVYVLKCTCSTFSWAREDSKEFGICKTHIKTRQYRHNLSLSHPHALQSFSALYHSPLQLETVQHGQGALMESDVRYKNLRATGNLWSQAAVINYLISVSLNQLLQSCFAGQCTSNFSLGLMSFISTAEFPFGLQKLLLSPVMLFDIMASCFKHILCFLGLVCPIGCPCL